MGSHSTSKINILRLLNNCFLLFSKMAEIEKLSFYAFLFIYKSWEKYPRCIIMFLIFSNQNPTWSWSTFQHKPVKTNSRHFKYMIKPPLKILGKFSNKSQRCTMTPSTYLVPYPIFPCSVFSCWITKTISGHFEKWIKHLLEII